MDIVIKINQDFFQINSWDDSRVILGVPFYSSFYILANMDAGKLGFAPGCDCDLATDGYPLIQLGSSTYSSGSSGTWLSVNTTATSSSTWTTTATSSSTRFDLHGNLNVIIAINYILPLILSLCFI